MRRAVRIGLIVAASIVALLFVGFIAVFVFFIWCPESSWGNKPFSAQEWQAAERETRYLYVSDLFKSQKLNGLSAAQVRSLLGPPDHENSEGSFRYLVKPMECSVDDWALDIDFENGKVKAYIIRAT